VIQNLFSNLETYINEENDIDTLINLAIIHYQFESIHPFYDGNGRTGRIINILYLVLNQLLDLPILYLSQYIIQNKSDYYRLLQEVRSRDNWHDWIMFILEAVEQTSLQTILLINDIESLMLTTKQQLKQQLPKIYSKDLIDIIFTHPYTKIDFLVDGLTIHRETASKYLKLMQKLGLFNVIKIGRSKYYINKALFERLKKGTMSCR
jgi:Fic family protein